MLTPSQAQLIADAAVGGHFELLRRALAPGGLCYCVNEETCTRIEGAPLELDRYPWPHDCEEMLDRPFAYSRAVTGHRRRERLSRTPGGSPLTRNRQAS